MTAEVTVCYVWPFNIFLTVARHSQHYRPTMSVVNVGRQCRPVCLGLYELAISPVNSKTSTPWSPLCDGECIVTTQTQVLPFSTQHCLQLKARHVLTQSVRPSVCHTPERCKKG